MTTRLRSVCAVLAVSCVSMALVSCGSDDDSSANDAPPSSEVGDEVSVDDVAYLVGMTEDEATADLEENALVLRVVERDGEPLAATLDFRTDRVNVAVEDGVVVSVVSVG